MAIFTKINTKIVIISGLIFLILVLILLKFLTPQGQPSPSISPSSTPEHFILASPQPSAAEKGDRGDPTFYEEIDKKLTKRFPLFPYLPYETKDFSIKYLGPLKLEIFLATESARIQALDWIRSKGVDPTTHQIIFK